MKKGQQSTEVSRIQSTQKSTFEFSFHIFFFRSHFLLVHTHHTISCYLSEWINNKKINETFSSAMQLELPVLICPVFKRQLLIC